jgi:glycerol-3-phosphate O-acyltransferase
MTNINNAADVNPINLLALALLATPKQAMDEGDLARQFDLYTGLLAAVPVSEWSTVTALGGREIIRYGEAMGVVRRKTHELGDIIYLEGMNAVLMTYFRNNILHLFTVPALIACCFVNNRVLSFDHVLYLIKLVYPYLRAELFLPWEPAELDAVARRLVDFLVARELLEQEPGQELLKRPSMSSRAGIQLMMLAGNVIHSLERFYIAIALLLTKGSGNISQADLERLCQLMTQRISVLYEFNAPEFFDKSLFRNFIRTLSERGIVWPNEEGLLVYNDTFRSAYEEAKTLLSEEVRHSLRLVTHGALSTNTDTKPS